MIHIYCGEGKGKTTCAFGLTLRAAGRGRDVVVAQFLKTGDSGERLALAHVPHVTLLPLPQAMKFTFAMTPSERTQAAADMERLLQGVEAALTAGAAMAVLDECCSALSTGLLAERRVTDFLERWGDERELVLTGRDPLPALTDRAHYITEMNKRRHPYDQGTPAREGVEW